MAEIKTESNPVGEPLENDDIATYVEIVKSEWDVQMQDSVKAPWWKFWTKISMTPITNFMLGALDDLIAYVDQVVDTTGPQKKATVLAAVGQIYDYISKEAFPVWFAPFSATIRTYVLDHVVATAIDWMVQKYRNGDWRKKDIAEIQSLWAIKAQMFGLPIDHRPKVY